MTYHEAAHALAVEHRVFIDGWRSGNTGRAWTNSKDGRRRIVAPYPRGPVSFGVFAHEVGHCVLHERNGNYPRWREEVEAWEFALAQFGRFGLRGEERCYTVAVRSLAYAFGKALRRDVSEEALRDAYPVWFEEAEAANAKAMFRPSMSAARASLDR